MSLGGVADLEGWRWLFIIEGLPAVVLGVVTLFYLTDRPEDARWLAFAPGRMRKSAKAHFAIQRCGDSPSPCFAS